MGSRGYDLSLDLDLEVPSFAEITEPLLGRKKSVSVKNKEGLWGIDPLRALDEARLMDSGLIERHRAASSSNASARSTSLSSSTRIKYDFFELSDLNLLADLSILDITSTSDGYKGRMKGREIAIRSEATSYGSIELADDLARLEAVFSRQLHGSKNHGELTLSAVEGEGLFERLGNEIKLKEGTLRGSGLDLSFDLPNSARLIVDANASANPLMTFSLADDEIKEKRGTLTTGLSRSSIRVKDGIEQLESMRSFSHSLQYNMRSGRIAGTAILSDH